MFLTNDNQSIELVITAPEQFARDLAYKAGARLTFGVLVRLITEAKYTLIIASPYLQNFSLLNNGELEVAFGRALERGVYIDVISTGTGLSKLEMDSLRRKSKGRIRFFRPQSNIDNERRLGLHAKICIADSEHVYVGSANITVPGLTEHLEMGLLVHGAIAQKITNFWMFLFESGFLTEIYE